MVYTKKTAWTLVMGIIGPWTRKRFEGFHQREESWR